MSSYYMELTSDMYVIINNVDEGIFKTTEEELEAFHNKLHSERLNYIEPIGEKLYDSDMASSVYYQHSIKSPDQESPIGRIVYDNGQGYSESIRDIHICPVTGKSFVTEVRIEIGGY